MARTVVIGAGISGLATAYLLRRSDPDHEVVVLEASDRVGGKVKAAEVAGLPVDTGPDSFLARAPQLRELIGLLGLGDEVVEPVQSGAYVWSRGKLRPLPPGAAFGLPERIWPLLRSGLLSPVGAARAGLDVVLPRTRTGADPTVQELVRPRFGRQVYERMVEPLLGGVHAGDAAEISARSTAPQIAGMADAGRSLYLTMRKSRAAQQPKSGASAKPGIPAKRPAPLVSLDGGMSTLVDALVAEVSDDLRTNTKVTEIAAAEDGLVVRTDQGDFPADRVVLAAPAWAAADILGPDQTTAADLLRQIPYVGVANVTFAFHKDDVPGVPSGTGFLVPPVEGEFIVGCSWLTSKWPHLVQDELVLIKAMVGRRGDQRWQDMTDEALIGEVRDDLQRMMGVTAEPVDLAVQRWPAALPQYTVGHADRLAQIESDLASLPGLMLVGAAYRGVGLAGCVQQATAAAETISRAGS